MTVYTSQLSRTVPKAARRMRKAAEPEARTALDGADVVLSKGQGNYESLSGQGRHAYYAFLCKCDLFTKRFQVPRFTGMLIEER